MRSSKKSSIWPTFNEEVSSLRQLFAAFCVPSPTHATADETLVCAPPLNDPTDAGVYGADPKMNPLAIITNQKFLKFDIQFVIMAAIWIIGWTGMNCQDKQL